MRFSIIWFSLWRHFSMHFPFERVLVFIFPLKGCAFQGGLCAWLCNGCFGGCAHLVRILAPGTPLWKDSSVTVLLYCSITVLRCYRDAEGSSCISVGSSCITAFWGCAFRLCAEVVRLHSHTTTASQPFEVVRFELHNVSRSSNLHMSAWHNVLKVV